MDDVNPLFFDYFREPGGVFKDCKRVFALKRQGKVFDAEAFEAVFKPSALRGDISAVSVLHQSFGNLHRSKFNPALPQFGQNLQHDRFNGAAGRGRIPRSRGAGGLQRVLNCGAGGARC